MSPLPRPPAPSSRKTLQAWGIPRQLALPDELLKRWQVCPNYATHLGGYCSRCKKPSKTLYCQICYLKTRPHQVTCSQCLDTGRSFRLLVEWLRYGKLKGAWLEALPSPIRKVVESHRPSPPSSHPRNQHPLIFSPDIWQSAKKKLSPPDSQEGFYDWLVLAWGIQQGDQEQAIHNQALTKLINQIYRTSKQNTKLTLEEFRRIILTLSYVPQPLLNMAPPLRTSLPQVRKSDSTMRRKQSQKDGSAEEPKADTIWEQIFFSKFGIDKMTRDLSRQIFWTWLFVPLVNFLLPYATRHKQDRWPSSPTKPIDPSKTENPILPDNVFIQASQILNLRYPALWEAKWQRVRERCTPSLKSPNSPLSS